MHSLVAAIPEDRLRWLVLELLLGKMKLKAPAAARPIAPNGKKPARGGWPAGKPRGPRHVKSEEKAAPEAKATADKPTDKQLATARRREGDRKRTARNGQTTSNGNANGQGATPHADDLAVRVWQHAAKLEPGAPWKCLRAHGVLDALSLDAYRVTRLPPGLRPDRSRSFLATPAG